jgi:hypothetical protein
MIKFGFLGAAAILSMAATPAFAQAAIQEPGMFAFYYPNGDLGLGSSRPPVDAMASVRVANSEMHAKIAHVKIGHELRRPD